MRVYPLRADAPHPFDVRWRDAHPVPARDQLPAQVSLLDHFGPVKDQGAEGSCSAQSGAAIVEALWHQAHGERVVLSPAFLYEVERLLQGDVQDDTGARLRVTQAALMAYGVCPEADDPYTPADFIVPLTARLLADARRYRIARGWWAPSLDEILAALVAGYPVQIGLVVTQTFEAEAVARTGQVPVPPPGDPVLGGHAMAAYGYDRAAGVVWVRNSWGAAWGHQGNCAIPFAYFRAPNLFLSARVYSLT
ncbi:MAG: C1 family peptidase [Actinomycetia bacterium]|nr:C1 family peptidase [Actinomycetes bacterium]